MGYTHYWRRPQTIPQPAWAGFLDDCRAIAAHLPERTTSAGGYYASAPLTLDDGAQIDDEVVIFNGAGRDPSTDEELGHETFWVEREYNENDAFSSVDKAGLFFSFCKTARKPYDVVVVACLCALAARCPKVRLSTDGTDADLREGIALFEQSTGRKATAWSD